MSGEDKEVIDTWSPSTRDKQEKIIELLKKQSETNLSIASALNQLSGADPAVATTGQMIGGRITLVEGSNVVAPANGARLGLMVQNLDVDNVYISVGIDKGIEGVAIEYMFLFENPWFLNVKGEVYVYATSAADICFFEV